MLYQNSKFMAVASIFGIGTFFLIVFLTVSNPQESACDSEEHARKLEIKSGVISARALGSHYLFMTRVVTCNMPDWSIPDGIDCKPMPKERLDAIMRMERLKYLHETRVINRNDIIQFERKIDLRDYHLMKGKYYLQNGCYSGKGVGQVMVGPATDPSLPK